VQFGCYPTSLAAPRLLAGLDDKQPQLRSTYRKASRSTRRPIDWDGTPFTMAENAASLALQPRCRFRVVGRRERIGKLAGSWGHTVLTERRSKKVGLE
jgi:L-amino acid N-acyltransferase YncA